MFLLALTGFRIASDSAVREDGLSFIRSLDNEDTPVLGPLLNFNFIVTKALP